MSKNIYPIMAFAKGRNERQADIDGKRDILMSLINEFPVLVNDEIMKCEKRKEQDAKDIANGDKNLEWSVRSSHPLNEYQNILSEMIPYSYQALINMIYSYTESTLREFCDYPKLPKGKSSDVEKLFALLQKEYNLRGVNNVKKVRYYWKNFDEFRKLRNSLVHEWRNSKNVNELWKINPQQYLRDNLDIIHQMLRRIETIVPLKHQ